MMHNPSELGVDKDGDGLYVEALKNIESITDDEKEARLYAVTVVLGHLERQISASYDKQDQYRRREQIRLQIARAKFKILMSDYYKSKGLPSPYE